MLALPVPSQLLAPFHCAHDITFWRAHTLKYTHIHTATQVDAEDAKRIGELSLEISREEKGLAELRSQTQGLEAQAAALQVKIDNAGALLVELSASVNQTHKAFFGGGGAIHLFLIVMECQEEMLKKNKGGCGQAQLTYPFPFFVSWTQPSLYRGMPGGEKLRKAKAAVAKLEKDMAEGEAEAAKKAVQVCGCTCFTATRLL